jgi:uncharacterized protein
MAEIASNENVLKAIEEKFPVKDKEISAVLEMLADEKTVPFIARDRKEATGGLDEEAIRAISDEYNYVVALEIRKADVIRLIEEKGMMTDALKEEILNAPKLIDVVDLYRPYKEKKKTKATEAIALGLEPLAEKMLKLYNQGDKFEIAKEYVTDKVKTPEEAIEKAKFIVAEKISDNAEFRKHIRDAALKYGTIICKKKKNDKEPDEKYKNYDVSSEKTGWIKPHRDLAINRAEDDDVISVTLELQPERDIEYLRKFVTRN